MTPKYIKWPLNSWKNDRLVIKYTHSPFQDPPKFTQIGIFVRKYTIWQPWFAPKISSNRNELKIKIETKPVSVVSAISSAPKETSSGVEYPAVFLSMTIMS
jgi:hypothetical protein